MAPGQQALGNRGPSGPRGGAAPGVALPGTAGAGRPRAPAGAETDQAAPPRAAAGFLHRRCDRGDAQRRGAEGKVSAAVVDARELFCVPGRAKRPKRIAVVLRGLPGSGAPFASPSSVRSATSGSSLLLLLLSNLVFSSSSYCRATNKFSNTFN